MKLKGAQVASLLLLVTVVGMRAADQNPIPADSSLKLEVGSIVPKKYRGRTDPITVCMTHPAQLDPCFVTKLRGIDFTVAYGKNTHKITYIHTRDLKFTTSDGVKIGGFVDVEESSLHMWPGWEIVGPRTRDGWYPLLGFNSEVVVMKGATEERIRKDHTGELREALFSRNAVVRLKIKGFSKAEAFGAK